MKIKQFYLGKRVGFYKVQLSRAYGYYGLVTGILAATAAREQLNEWFPWLPFWGVILALAVGLHIIMVVDYVLVRKAEIEYNTSQTYDKINPMTRDLKLIKKKLGIKDEES